MVQKLDALLDAFLKMGVPGYDCRILKDGKCIYHRMGGYADLENKLPMTGNERYNIYSFTKAITCTAALQLWEKGAFQLDDRLCDYLPEFTEMTVLCEDGTVKPAQNPILIRHLFTMTAGLHYSTKAEIFETARQETEGRCPTRETMRYLAKEPLLFEPGSRYHYSFCHDVLAALIEVLTGQRYGEYLKEHIFVPLGMNCTTLLLPTEELDTITPQYRFNNETGKAENCGKEISSYKLGSEYESGGAGGISTAEDYLKLLEALRVGDVILKKETVDMMQTDQLNDQSRTTFWYTTHGYGLGTRAPLEGKSTDFGWGSASGMFHLVDRKNGISAVYMQHLLSSPNGMLRRLVLGPNIINAALGYEAIQAPPLDDASAELLSKYL